MKKTVIISALIMSSSMLLCSCQPRHIRPYTPRERIYEPDKYAADVYTEAEKENTGSLWSSSVPSLFEDLRASRLGDILTVVIDEDSEGKGNASTKLGSDSKMSKGISGMFGLMAALARRYPDLNPEQLIEFMGGSSFDGKGNTARSGELRGKIAVRVKQVMPNSDLFVEGHKVILLNEEELHFYISGVVRQTDVQPDNSIRSSVIADAQVEFSGRGVVTDQQSPGWLYRFMDKVKPI